MQASRRSFESKPDTGIFGKNFARVWNLIEVYLFRFLIVGIIIVLILFPAAIILNIMFSVVFALTSWLWIPIYLVLRYLYLYLFL